MWRQTLILRESARACQHVSPDDPGCYIKRGGPHGPPEPPHRRSPQADVIEGRELAAQAVLAVEVDLGHGEPFAVRDLRDHRAPGVGDEGMAVGRPSLA